MNKKTFSSGLLLILIPLLGVPLFWKFFFIVLIGLFLIFTSIKINISAYMPKKSNRNDGVAETLSIHSLPEKRSHEPEHVLVQPSVTILKHIHKEKVLEPQKTHRVGRAKQVMPNVESVVSPKKTRSRKKSIDI